MEFILDKIEERDVDFLVMRAFQETWFARYFLQYTMWPEAKVVHIEHSFTDPELGESDITVIVSDGDQRYGLLIENKIDAVAMPDQHLRYQKRGERGKCEERYADFCVFLIAPQAYLDTNEEAQKYEVQIAYERLADLLLEHGQLFDAKVLRDAVAKKESGYIVQEVPAITQFWRELYAYCAASSYAVDMYPSVGAKGSRSTWPQFRVLLQGTSLYYKAAPGVVDLQFSGKLKESGRLKGDLLAFLEEDMHWVDTGRSLSLRIKAQPMDFTKPFSGYVAVADEMLRAVERLTLLAAKLSDQGYTV